MSVVTLREITAATVRLICALETREEQKHFVAANALSLAQAYFEPRAIFRAIYAGEIPVGFVMWKPADDPEVAYLWRFVVDHNHQKKGYAKQAIRQLIDLLRDAGYRRMQTSVVLGGGGPLDFYRLIGIRRDWRNAGKRRAGSNAQLAEFGMNQLRFELLPSPLK